MAMLYSWATKEYLLWEMSIGQIIMYHNLGIEMKYPQETGKPTLRTKSAAELRQMREEMRRLGMIDSPGGDDKDGYRAKYGDV